MKTLLMTTIFLISKLSLGQEISHYVSLESTPSNSPYFQDSIIELQKIHYLSGDWDKFFGYALFYREKVRLGKFSLKIRPITLEILGLIKHCSFSEAKKLGEFYLSQTRDQKSRNELKSALHFLEVKQTLTDSSTISDAKSISQASKFEEELYWPITDLRHLSTLERPNRLRVHLESKCK